MDVNNWNDNKMQEWTFTMEHELPKEYWSEGVVYRKSRQQPPAALGDEFGHPGITTRRVPATGAHERDFTAR